MKNIAKILATLLRTTNPVATNTINEKTADVGVDVDGVLCKDGKIEAGAVPDHATTHQNGGDDEIVNPLNLGAIPTTLTGKDADSVDGKEPGTASSNLMYYEAASFPRFKWSADYTAGDNLLAAADSQYLLEGTAAYAKKKEITIHKAGTLRVKFTLALPQPSSAGTIYGKIYKNGVAQGTERSVSIAEDFITFSEDLAYTVDDTCELWIKTVDGHIVGYEDFRIYAALPPLEIPEVTLDG